MSSSSSSDRQCERRSHPGGLGGGGGGGQKSQDKYRNRTHARIQIRETAVKLIIRDTER